MRNAFMRNKTVKTRWDPKVDNKPENGPRFKYTQIFGSKYLGTANRILDVGCGIGNYLYLNDREGCFGIDLESQSLKTAKKYCIKSDFAVASVLNLPFRNETFDLIVMWEVIEHVPAGTEMQAFAEVHRTLAACGSLLLSTPNKNIISNIMDPAYILGHRHYDAKNLVKFISEIGFSVMHFTIRGNLATLIAVNLFYFYKHIFHKKGTKLQQFFDQKSEKEFNSKKGGIANIYIAAKKR
jgi:2-polyprenyl-3-methyl-5-hydroxy-6-metoxy-1,4-benzoquinol methylase